jgi:hypothetical protein
MKDVGLVGRGDGHPAQVHFGSGKKTGAPVLIGLRDRALIALMGYTFARVGAAVDMKVEDYYIQKRRV